MKKCVFYFMTRNIYRDVVPSLKSLLKNGNIDRAYLMIEDNDIGFDLPAKVITMNIRDWKTLLDPDGPNYQCRWSYMVMMKVLLCKIMPKLSRALTIDCDTIIREDISRLWDMDLTNKYFAGAREPYWSKYYGRDYVNAGVLMWNLDRMREGMADTVLKAMNTRKYTFTEQDALNDCCRGEIALFDAAYNRGDWTERPTDCVKIEHFMASKGAWKNYPEVIRYRDMDWEEVIR